MGKKIGLFVLGVILVWVGISLGTMQLTANEGSSDVAACGSAISPNSSVSKSVDEFNAALGRPTDTATICRDKLGTQKIPAWGLIGLGAAVALGTLFLPGAPRAAAI